MLFRSYRYIDSIREAGFVVNKLYGNVYAMGKVARGLSDFNKLIYFTEEEAYIVAKIINSIDVKSNFFFSTFKKFSFQLISAVCIQHKVGHFCYSL